MVKSTEAHVKSDLGVAKPTGLFAFGLCLSLMALWNIRCKQLRLCVLQRASGCVCALLLLPCVYGFSGVWLHCIGSGWSTLPSFWWLLKKSACGLLQAKFWIQLRWPQRKKADMEKRLKSRGPRVTPWNIRGVHGRQKKKHIRLIFCQMLRPFCKTDCLTWAMCVRRVIACALGRFLCSAQVVVSVLLMWQHVWQEYLHIRVWAFVCLWLQHGEDAKCGVFAVMALLCTIVNLHCTWCRTLSFATCWLLCPNHGIIWACLCAFFAPFAPPKTSFPAVEMRKASGRQKGDVCLRWRCRSVHLLETHAELFESLGMAVGGSCHTLETKAMSTDEGTALMRGIADAVAAQGSFVEKYGVLWNKLKICMSWEYPKIRMEETKDVKLARGTVHVTNAYVQKVLQRHFGADVSKTFRTAATVTSGLHACVEKHTIALSKCFGLLEIAECLLQFFKEVAAERLNWQSKEASLGSLLLEASLRSAALHRAQGTLEPTKTLLEGFKVVNLMLAIRKENTYTGLINFKFSTCWMNASVQLMWHSGIVLHWLYYDETVERMEAQRPFPSRELKQLDAWMGRYEVIAPFELLHFVLDHWQNFGFIDRQCDAAEFLEIMHQLSRTPACTPRFTVCFNHEALLRRDCEVKEARCLQEVVELMLKDKQLAFEVASEQVLLQRSPYTADEINGELQWIESKIEDWNAEVDLGNHFAESAASEIRFLLETSS